MKPIKYAVLIKRRDDKISRTFFSDRTLQNRIFSFVFYIPPKSAQSNAVIQMFSQLLKNRKKYCSHKIN